MPRFPIDAFQLIGQDYVSSTAVSGNRHLERVSFDLILSVRLRSERLAGRGQAGGELLGGSPLRSTLSLLRKMGILNLLVFKVFLSAASTSFHQFKNVPHFPPHLAHNSVHRPEVVISGSLADFSTVIGPFFDRFAEVVPNEDARIRILGRRLGEVAIRAEHW